MKIFSIRLKNLNSLRSEVEIDFEAEPLSHTGLFAITGDTGAGKTTILDAVTLAFFGRTSREHEREVMSNGATEASAEVVFGTEKGRFLARWAQKRTKSKDQPLKTLRELARWHDDVWITLETGRKVDSTAREKGAVEMVLGLNYDQFKRTVLLAQGEFAAFLKADEKDRAAVLERLTNTEDYSVLSRAAHLRALEERRLLDQLQTRRQSIAVLDPGQLSALQETLRERESQAAVHHRDRETWRANLAWLDALAGLLQRQRDLEEETEALVYERTAFGPDLLRLEGHRRTVAFQPSLTRLRELEAEQELLSDHLAELEAQETALRAETAALEAGARVKQTEFEQAETAAAADEAVFARVAGLDQALLGQETLVRILQSGLADLEEKCRDLTERLAGARESREATTRDQAGLRKWLSLHQAEANLAADLDSLRTLHGQRLFALRTEIRQVQEEKSEALARLESARRILERTLKDVKAARDQLESLQRERAAESSAAGLPAEENEAEAEIDRRVEQAAAQLQSLEDFTRYQGDYRRIAEELADMKDAQSNLTSEDYALGKELLSVLDLLDELRRKVAVKRQRYEEELRKANYDRDRSALRDGEPCPLCGATHHPLAVHEAATSFVDDAQSELQGAEKQLQTAEQRHAALAARHAALRDRLGNLQEDLDEVVTSQARHLLARLAEYEGKIVGVLPSLGLPDPDVLIPETYFRERIEDMRGQLSELRQQRARLAGLGRSIREQERELSVLEQAGRGAEADVQIAAAAQEDLLQREDRAVRQRDEESAALGRRLKPYGLTFTADDPLEPLLEELAARSERFTEQTEREAESQRRLRELSASIEQLERQQAERLTERQAKEQALRIEEDTLDRNRRERAELFGHRDPQAERALWSETLARLRREAGDVRALHQEHRLRLTAVEADRRQRHHQRAQTDQRRQTLLRELHEGLEAAGFHDLDQLAGAILPADEAAALELSAAALDRRGAELDRSRRDVGQALARERAREFPAQERAEAEVRWQEAESAFQAAQREIGSLQRQLEENDRRGRDAAELLAAVERQQQEYDRWESLRELIGSHDGSAFRKFAQSLTLQQLVQRANRHLARLQGGRYRLQKQRDADLEIEIVDTYQADYVRSVSTLSGGETFLASLALALGLADMAGRHTRIQSLFIDEGFGALDENALELAITTLESLQAEGATIGIISHLRELKERISTQIQVVRRSDGFSEVRVTA